MTAANLFDVLLEASVRATMIAAFVALALAAFRAKSPAVRHAAWTAVLITMLALPALSAWLPTFPLPLWLARPR